MLFCKNTVALKADKEAGYYKLFANGRLVATYSGSQLTNGFKFIQDIEGANKIVLGSTYRGGAPSYNFAGTIHYAEAYAAPLTDEELLAVTSETSDHPQYRVQSVSVPGAAFTMDKAYAAEGESVTVQIGEIETGKLLKNVQVADVSGNAVPVTTVEEGKTYSFTMPASAVSVSVELEDVISGEAHLLNIQYGPNVELEVTGSTEVILDANGIYGATVKGGESITLHFTPVDGTFASALLNGEAIDCTAEDCTYTFTMPDQNKVLRFTFQLVRKDLLGVVLEKAEAVTKEELDKLVPSVQKKFTTALKNAQSVYADLNATQAEVDEAWKDLIDAMHYLNFEKGEKEALEELVHTAEQVKLDEFTPSSQTAFTEALEAARAICAEDEVLKEEVENAYQALHDAIMALVRKADFSALQVLVDEAEGYDLDAYIQNEALKSFQKVLKEASALLDDENASQKVVDEMASELLNAMAALRRVPSKEALEELLRNLEAIGPEGYTAASYAAFRSQVSLMWAVYNDGSATDEQIAKACAIGEKAPSLLKSTATTAKKTSHTVSRSNTYGTAGTVVAVASPVVAAAQHVTAQAYVRSDTTANFTLKQGSAYCFKMTVVNGGDSIPGFTAGNGGVLKTQFVARLGNDYYYRVYAVGAPGTSAGVYTTLPGQNAVRHCVVTIG